MIHVPDVAAAASWYERLGFTIERTHSDDGVMSWALLSFGTTEVMFSEGGRPSDAHRREVDLYIHTDDVAETFVRIGGEVDVVEPPHDTFYGMRELIVRDLNGFWLTFGEPLAHSS